MFVPFVLKSTSWCFMKSQKKKKKLIEIRNLFKSISIRFASIPIYAIICLTHKSHGNFQTESFVGYDRGLRKDHIAR